MCGVCGCRERIRQKSELLCFEKSDRVSCVTYCCGDVGLSRDFNLHGLSHVYMLRDVVRFLALQSTQTLKAVYSSTRRTSRRRTRMKQDVHCGLGLEHMGVELGAGSC